MVGNPRTAHLEERDKRKLAFTGDSELLLNKNISVLRPSSLDVENAQDTVSSRNKNLEDALFLIEKYSSMNKRHSRNKHNKQEAVSIRYDTPDGETLKNNIDLKKIQEARRLLRKRYTNSKNLQKVYSIWDEEKSGRISVENIYNISKKLKLNLNFDESRVLLASVDKKGAGVLGADDFIDLIYNKTDTFNVDFDQLSSMPLDS